MRQSSCLKWAPKKSHTPLLPPHLSTLPEETFPREAAPFTACPHLHTTLMDSPEPSSLFLGDLIHSHGLKCHIFTDNTHIYITGPKLQFWFISISMSHGYLKHNEIETELQFHHYQISPNLFLLLCLPHLVQQYSQLLKLEIWSLTFPQIPYLLHTLILSVLLPKYTLTLA